MPTIQEKSSARTLLAVDFPRQGETVTGAKYSMRLSAPDSATRVDISIDQGEWRPCRRASGYWWFDWSDYQDGEHEIVARAQVDGKQVSCEPHVFFVRLAR